MKISLFIILSIIIQFNCLAQNVPTINSILGDTTSYEEVIIPLKGGCSLACAIDWEMTASSSLRNQNGISYTIDNIEDGDPTTAWIVGNSNYGIGEAINIKFSSVDVFSVAFYEIGLNNGYCKSKKLWRENSRVKELYLKKTVKKSWF